MVSERSGRRRLFRLKNADVAAAVEALGALAQNSGTSAVPEVRFARTCYDHLAGVLAIAARNELLKRGALQYRKDAFDLTPKGTRAPTGRFGANGPMPVVAATLRMW